MARSIKKTKNDSRKRNEQWETVIPDYTPPRATATVLLLNIFNNINNNNNNNTCNYTRTIFIVLSSAAKPYARVHSGHLSESIGRNEDPSSSSRSDRSQGHCSIDTAHNCLRWPRHYCTPTG